MHFRFFVGNLCRQIRSGTVKANMRVGKYGPKLSVSLSAYGAMIVVRRKETQEWLGLLDSDTGTALNHLLSRYSVHLVSFIPIVRWTDKDGYFMVNRSETYQVHTIIYGTSEELDSIGGILSDEGIFLQHPTYIDCHTTYENPQYLRRPGTDMEIPAALSSNSYAKKFNLTTDRLEQLFESAQGPQTFSEVRVSPRLRSTLKRYVVVRVVLTIICHSWVLSLGYWKGLRTY